MRLKLILILLASCFFSLAHAAATTSSDLTALLDTIKSMQSNFTQKIFDNKGKLVQTSYGTMSFARPGKFRWQVIKPIPQLIIANASTIWIYDPDLAQVTIRKLNNATGETPALLLSHSDIALDKTFIIKKLTSKLSGQWFELKPRNAENNMFASIQMGFVNGQIKEMNLKDQLGHNTSIQFSNIKTNLTLSPALFTFKAQEKVDVIDETRQ